MKQRVITGSILVVVLGVLIYFGEGELEFLFSGFCVLLSVLAAFEFTKMLRANKPNRWFDFIAVISTALFSTVSMLYLDTIGLFIYVFIALVVVILLYAIIFVFIKDFTRNDFGNQILTIFYCSLGFIALAYLRQADIYYIIYLLLVAMITDVFAYLFGIKFGKHRLAIHISPKKSIEGAIGGLAVGALAAALFAYYLDLFDFGFILILLLSVVLSAIAQIGDLIASKFKREVGIKDYSNIFPGHGGVLDRFDSSMFVAIFLMLAVMLF